MNPLFDRFDQLYSEFRQQLSDMLQQLSEGYVPSGPVWHASNMLYGELGRARKDIHEEMALRMPDATIPPKEASIYELRQAWIDGLTQKKHTTLHALQGMARILPADERAASALRPLQENAAALLETMDNTAEIPDVARFVLLLDCIEGDVQHDAELLTRLEDEASRLPRNVLFSLLRGAYRLEPLPEEPLAEDIADLPDLPEWPEIPEEPALPDVVEPVVIEEPAPVVETVVVEEPAPVVETVVVEEPAPVVETVVVEEPAPVVETVVVEEPAPVVETVVVEGPAPVVETVVIGEPAPVVETVVVEEPAPVVETVVIEEPAPVVETVVVEEPAPVEAPIPCIHPTLPLGTIRIPSEGTIRELLEENGPVLRCLMAELPFYGLMDLPALADKLTAAGMTADAAGEAIESLTQTGYLSIYEHEGRFLLCFTPQLQACMEKRSLAALFRSALQLKKLPALELTALQDMPLAPFQARLQAIDLHQTLLRMLEADPVNQPHLPDARWNEAQDALIVSFIKGGNPALALLLVSAQELPDAPVLGCNGLLCCAHELPQMPETEEANRFCLTPEGLHRWEGSAWTLISPAHPTPPEDPDDSEFDVENTEVTISPVNPIKSGKLPTARKLQELLQGCGWVMQFLLRRLPRCFLMDVDHLYQAGTANGWDQESLLNVVILLETHGYIALYQHEGRTILCATPLLQDCLKKKTLADTLRRTLKVCPPPERIYPAQDSFPLDEFLMALRVSDIAIPFDTALEGNPALTGLVRPLVWNSERKELHTGVSLPELEAVDLIAVLSREFACTPTGEQQGLLCVAEALPAMSGTPEGVRCCLTPGGLYRCQDGAWVPLSPDAPPPEAAPTPAEQPAEPEARQSPETPDSSGPLHPLRPLREGKLPTAVKFTEHLASTLPISPRLLNDLIFYGLLDMVHVYFALDMYSREEVDAKVEALENRGYLARYSYQDRTVLCPTRMLRTCMQRKYLADVLRQKLHIQWVYVPELVAAQDMEPEIFREYLAAADMHQALWRALQISEPAMAMLPTSIVDLSRLRYCIDLVRPGHPELPLQLVDREALSSTEPTEEMGLICLAEELPDMTGVTDALRFCYVAAGHLYHWHDGAWERLTPEA